MINFDKMIDDTIESLVNGNSSEAAESLVEMAMTMHKAGFPPRGFASTRAHIVAEAKRRSDSFFIEERLKLAEKELQRARAFQH